MATMQHFFAFGKFLLLFGYFYCASLAF